MKIEIDGIAQGTIELDVAILPREGERLKIFYGPDADVEGIVQSIGHTINQHDGSHQITVTIEPVY